MYQITYVLEHTAVTLPPPTVKKHKSTYKLFLCRILTSHQLRLANGRQTDVHTHKSAY